MKIFSPEVGRLAVSRQGRDKGRLMLILSVLDQEYVLVADGALRKLGKPKKKKLKHLRLCPETAKALAEKMLGGERITDHDIRSSLQTLATAREMRKEV